MNDRTDWDKRAGTYDSLAWVHNQDLLDWTAGHALVAIRAAIERTGFDRVLEVGCGTGALTERLAQAGVSMVAVDVSREMLSKATARLWDHTDHVEFAPVRPEGPLPSGPFAAVVSRMVLHHAPESPLRSLVDWHALLPSGGAIVVAEGPPPAVDDRHPANDLYRAAMALKEPGRHVFHAHDVADWLLTLGCEDVRTAERWTDGNSVRGWLSGGGIEPSRAEAILALHREAPTAARSRYFIRETGDGDVLMRWRHCVVSGVRS